MHRRCLLLGLVLIPLAGGCSRSGDRVLGVAPAGPPTAIRTARSAGTGEVVLTGEMVEKCPVSGCWFDLRDESGTIRIDTKNAGFVVLEVPLHSRVTVAGRIKGSEEERQLEAVGVRY